MSGKNEQGKMDVKQKNGKQSVSVKEAIEEGQTASSRDLRVNVIALSLASNKLITACLEHQLIYAVFNAPLHQHSAPAKTAVTGYSSGMCSSEMPLALNLTSSFLDWSQQQGTDLRKSGIKEGTRLCGYVNTWKAAVDAGIDDVPKVKLEATHHHALDIIGLDTLKKYAADQDNKRAESRVVMPKEGKQSIARESDQIGGKEPKA